MGNTEVPGETTYVLKWWDGICMGCKGCEDKVRKHLEKIHGVNFIGKIHIDNRQGKATIKISGTVGLHTVEEKFQTFNKAIKNVKLIPAKVRRPPRSLEPDALGESTSRKKTNNCRHSKSDLQEIIYNKPFKCDGCREDGFGSRYRCKEKKCGYELHKECNDRHRTKTIELFKKQITFNFCSRAPKEGKPRCNACGERIHGCFYKSAELNLHPCCSRLVAEIPVRIYKVAKLNLHSGCSSLKAEIPIPNTDTIFRLCKENSKIECLWCNNKESRGWSYVSSCNKCQLHLCCVPKMAKHIWKTSDHNAVDISKTVETINSEIGAKSIRKGAGKSTWKIFLEIILQTTLAILGLANPIVGLLAPLAQGVINIGSKK